MYDWRSPRVKEVEAFENLPAPTSQNLGLHHLKAFQVSAGGIMQQGGKGLDGKRRFHFQDSVVGGR